MFKGCRCSVYLYGGSTQSTFFFFFFFFFLLRFSIFLIPSPPLAHEALTGRLELIVAVEVVVAAEVAAARRASRLAVHLRDDRRARVLHLLELLVEVLLLGLPH